MALGDDLERIAAAAVTFAQAGDRLTGILATEPEEGRRVFVCAFESDDGHSWLALDSDGAPVADRRLVRDAVSIAALCEVAEESAGGGDLDDLQGRLADLRATEAPEGLDEAEAAAAALAATIQSPPRLATNAYLDALGVAARRLERALGDDGASPFAVSMQTALPAVEELAAQVERGYKGPLQ
jgi:hypothetical protein